MTIRKIEICEFSPSLPLWVNSFVWEVQIGPSTALRVNSLVWEVKERIFSEELFCLFVVCLRGLIGINKPSKMVPFRFVVNSSIVLIVRLAPGNALVP